jgi:hypothetical protein
MTSDPVATARQWLVVAELRGSPTVPISPRLVDRLLSELAIACTARDDARAERDGLDEAYETVVATNRRLAASTTAGRDTATARKENPR